MQRVADAHSTQTKLHGHDIAKILVSSYFTIFHYLAENCEQPQDHAMPVVGYGSTEEGEQYWLLKNSWGSQWGEAGYLRLPRGMPGNGSLGLAANPGFPVKIRANPKHPHKPRSWFDSMLRRTALQ